MYELIDDCGVMRGLYRSQAEAAAQQQPGWVIVPAGEYDHQRAKRGPVKVVDTTGVSRASHNS